jgi:aerobic-type carbon monoxide dehydrogenase small subunit (CoxS/CutS family)
MKLNVNDQEVQVPDAVGEQALIWTLQDQLAMNGPRYGCGAGLCGCCTVLMDDQVTRACQISTKAAHGKKLQTLESLSQNDQLHPVQKVFSVNPLQCNYCVNGHVMTAVALLKNNPDPTFSQIEEAVDINLCRCGGYLAIYENVKKAAQLMKRGSDK